MKNTLRLMALAIGFMAFTTSQAVTICFNDGFGNYQVSASKTGPMYWELSGDIDLGAGPWPVTGYWNRFTQEFYAHIENPAPDGCTALVDAVNLYSVAGSWSYGVMDWDWDQWCDGAVYYEGDPFPVTYTNGACPGRMMEMDPLASLASTSFDPSARPIYALDVQDTRDLEMILDGEEPLKVNRMGEGFTFFSNVFTQTGAELIIYNHAGQQVAILNSNGSNTIIWDGITTNGQNATSGMYIGILRNGEENITVKFVK